MECFGLNTFLSSFYFCIIGAVLVCCSSAQETQEVAFLNVSCNHMNLHATVAFREVFKGIVFAEGSFFNPNCKFTTNNTGTTELSLVFSLTECNNRIHELNGDIFVSNTISVQNHPILQTDYDIVQKISCKFPVHQMDHFTQLFHISNPTYFKNDELEAYMDFQFQRKTLGLHTPNKLLVGDSFIILINVKDGGRHKDFQVGSCWAYEGETMETSSYSLKVYDSFKCRNEFIANFTVLRGIENVSDSTVYGTAKAFKFPVSTNLYITCSVQACMEGCFKYCDPESARSNHYPSRSKRSPNDSPDKFFRERHLLMKATIKALGSRLMEKRNMSQNDANYYRRSSKEEDTTMTLTTVADAEQYSNSTEMFQKVIFNFNVTNSLEVYSGNEFNIIRDYDQPTVLPVECVPRLRFGVITASLSFAVFCLMLICIGFVLHIRKVKKRTSIDNFLLYNLY